MPIRTDELNDIYLKVINENDEIAAQPVIPQSNIHIDIKAIIAAMKEVYPSLTVDNVLHAFASNEMVSFVKTVKGNQWTPAFKQMFAAKYFTK